MKTELFLFLCQFGTIFALGFQQMNVQARHYSAAAFTSLAIGAFQAFVWKSMPEATVSQIVAWLAAGPAGIVCSMWLHPILFRKRVDKVNPFSTSSTLNK